VPLLFIVLIPPFFHLSSGKDVEGSGEGVLARIMNGGQ
jgi:hypothetical protein